MARQRINPTWMEDKKNEIARHKATDGKEPFRSVTSSFNLAIKWLIMALLDRGLEPKVENVGAGVKRISIKGTCCNTCGREIND